MLEKKQRIIIVVLSVTMVVLAVFFIIRSIDKKTQQQLTTDELEALPAIKNEITIDSLDLSDGEMQSQVLIGLSKDFASRFGSYYATGDLEYLYQIESIMTQSFGRWVFSSYKNQLQSQYPDNNDLLGISTQALVANLEKFDDQKAQILVQTKRTKKYKNNEEMVFDQVLSLDWVKQNNQWLIDGAYWLK